MFRVREQIACPLVEETDSPVTIAFLDTGVSLHPDLCDRIVCFKDFVNHRNVCYDDAGHGTHVCGIAAGSGKLSQGRYRGVAPDVSIVMGKVLDESGDGAADTMMQGLAWILEQREAYKIRILNISIGVGSLEDAQKKQELLSMVERAWNQGLVVVCAAGNLGPKPGSISPLGAGSKVITVGCHDGMYFRDKNNRCETYSGRGPTRYTIKKPDLVAPGTEIISCNAGFRKTGDGYFQPYIRKSGTSMATPQVAGAAALILQKKPYLSNEMVKKKLLYAATDLGEPWTKQGWGMLHIQRALEG